MSARLVVMCVFALVLAGCTSKSDTEQTSTPEGTIFVKESDGVDETRIVEHHQDSAQEPIVPEVDDPQAVKSTVPVEASISNEETPLANDLGPQTEVPPAHPVTYYRPTYEPGLQLTHGGTLIANLGAASDEFQEELTRVAEEVESSLSAHDSEAGATPNLIFIAADNQRVSDLFHPNDPEVSQALPGLLFWVVDAGAAHLWLRESEPLLAAIRRAGAGRSITQVVLLKIELCPAGAVGEALTLQTPPGALEFARLLSDAGIAGVNVGAVPDDGVFFFEVSRPDCVLGALRLAPLPTERITLPPDASYYVARAPRLRRLTLAAIDEPTPRTRHELFKELLSREIALLCISDQEGGVQKMSWPEIGEAIPVYPDASSLFQAVEDLKIPPKSFALSHFSPRDLFTWVDKLPVGGVALNAYKDRYTPKYLFVTKAEIFALARGQIPGDSPAR